MHYFTKLQHKRGVRFLCIVITFVFLLCNQAVSQRWTYPSGITFSSSETYCQGAASTSMTAEVSTSACSNGASSTATWEIRIHRASDDAVMQTCGGSPNNCSFTPPTSDCGDENYYAVVEWDPFSSTALACAIPNSGGSFTSDQITITIDCDCGGEPDPMWDCIQISEFCQRPVEQDGRSDDTGEWVELRNTCGCDVDISCFVLCLVDQSSGERRGECITVPDGTIVLAGETFVFGGFGANCSGGTVDCDWPDLALDLNWHGDPHLGWDVVDNVFYTTNVDNWIGVLTNAGEDISLYNALGGLIEAVTYSGGTGHTTDETFSIGSVAGCVAKSVIIPATGAHLDVGTSDRGFNKECDGSWTEINDISFHTPGTTTCEATSCLLPIELYDFWVTKEKNSVEIHWTTSSETNNDFFTVEKSNTGYDWEVVDYKEGAGNTTVTLNYTLIDRYPYSEVSYYRLKQTDYDGKYSYSEIKSINIDNNLINKKLLKTVNLMGQEVRPEEKGIVIYIYTDGSTKKRLNN